MQKKPRRVDAEPPYTRYAFLNPYNLSLVAGAGVAAAATGQWWIGVCGAAAEALWLLFAPESSFLRRTWFDRMWAESRADARRKALEEKIAELHPSDQARAWSLGEQKERIRQLAQDNPSLRAELLQTELDRLDGLVADFVRIALRCARAERHLQSVDLRAMHASWQSYRSQVEAMPEGDKRRAVAKKNMEVLEQRRTRWEELGRNVHTARGHLDLIENTFKLIGDEIVTMSTPDALGARVDQMRIAVEAIRETSIEEAHIDEAAALLEAEEEDEELRGRA